MKCASVLHQIEVCVKSVIEMLDSVDEDDLLKRPTDNKQSVGELFEHIALICEADWRISNEATKEEMAVFYSDRPVRTVSVLKARLAANFEVLKTNYLQMSRERLEEETISYWGLKCTRYEWLLEILAHHYHHRGQLHAILVHCYQKDPGVRLFE